MRYAEDTNYWSTTVHPATSEGEISALLEGFGASAIMKMSAVTPDGRYLWMIRFQIDGRSYQFRFTPLACRQPEKSYSFSGKRRMASEQARYQMGRIALGMVKAVMTAAEADPAALFGFLELPGKTNSGGIPATAADLDVSGLMELVPGFLLLKEGE